MQSRSHKTSTIAATIAALGLSIGSVGFSPNLRAIAEDAPAEKPVDLAKAKKAAEEEQKIFIDKVNKAIDLGQKFLLEAQNKTGTWSGISTKAIDVDYPGYNYLAMLALAKTGLKATDAKMKTTVDALANLVASQKMFRTYPAGCLAMLIDALYAEHLADGKIKARLTPDAKKMLLDIVASLEKNQIGIWRYPNAGEEDLSASQYALLGLFTADRLGIKVKPATYRRAMKTILSWQEQTGPTVPYWTENAAWDPGSRYPQFIKTGTVMARGFRYQKDAGLLSGSMTTAGVAALAIIKDRLKDDKLKADALTREEEKLLDKGILDGIGWLSENFAVDKNPGSPRQWHFYYLYGLERMCDLIGVKFIGKHNWYKEGAEYLISKQLENGSWPKTGDHAAGVIEETSFALLFLKRATSPTKFKVPPVTGGPDELSLGDEDK